MARPPGEPFHPPGHPLAPQPGSPDHARTACHDQPVHRSRTAGRDGLRSVIFQLWHWHEDGERYDLELFHLTPDATGHWQTDIRRSTYWALTQSQLTALASEAGFTTSHWQLPARMGFFQPLLIARAP
ncbi:hypothetical protein [Kitasatospora sp. NPDC056731]|uniref:hypothetical protein n=1 Tax=Kitasatospora sp. NPDC056731 TaxID=3155422 RepID=UPI003448F3DE